MYPELEQKVAIVTGAGRPQGLGAAIARRLAAEGALVVVHDLGRTKGDLAPSHGVGLEGELEAVAAGIKAAGGEASVFAADLIVEAEVQALVEYAVKTYGRLDILINNAGVGYLFSPLIEQTQDQWDTVIGVNMRAAFFGMKYAIRQMLTQPAHDGWGGGRIVSIASQAGKSGFANGSSYVASKHGLIGLTRSAAVECGPHQITVNAICPNHVTTGLGAWQNDYNARVRGQTLEELRSARLARIPLGRIGLPEDTANACAFVCSSQANYITGEAMNVSGGEEMH